MSVGSARKAYLFLRAHADGLGRGDRAGQRRRRTRAYPILREGQEWVGAARGMPGAVLGLGRYESVGRKKTRHKGGFFAIERTVKVHSESQRLQRGDVRSLQTLRAVLDFERHALVFLQRLEAVGTDFREVSEQIVTASVRLDEAKALGVVEPLYDTGLHGIAFQKKYKRNRWCTHHRTANSRKGHHGQPKYQDGG